MVEGEFTPGARKEYEFGRTEPCPCSVARPKAL